MNTISTDLATKTYHAEAIATLAPLLAPVAAYAVVYQGDPKKPKNSGTIPNTTVPSATISNALDWEVGSGTIEAIAYTPRQLSKPFHLTNAQSQGGSLHVQLARTNLQDFAKDIAAIPMGLLTVANYGAACLVTAATSFGIGDLGTFLAAVQSPNRTLLLSSAYFARLIAGPVPPNWTLPGFTHVLEVDFSAAGPNVVGCVCDPSAIAIVASTPVEFPFPPIETLHGVIPGINLPFATSSWGAPGTRTQWVSYDVIISASVAKSGALKLITSQ